MSVGLQTKQVSKLGEASGLISNWKAGRRLLLLLQMTQKAVKFLSPVP
jgi:hypothetical protein